MENQEKIVEKINLLVDLATKMKKLSNEVKIASFKLNEFIDSNGNYENTKNNLK